MLNKTTVQLMALGFVGSIAATAAAQDSGALIDALVRKGVLKDQEAEQIRSQLSRDFAANSPAGKLNLSSSVKELKLSGDVRLRFQYDSKDAQTGVSNVSQRDRWRLRLRINGDYKLSDNFFAGFGLQTEQKNDSGNQTMAGGAGNNSITANSQGTSTSGDYSQNYNIYINKAFIGWNVTPGVTLIGGKQVNPLYTTDMVWDPDINPTGFSQRVDFHKFLDLGPLELSLVGLQNIVSDNTESNVSGKTNRDAWIYHTQLIAGYKVAEGVKVTIAPGFYCSNAGALSGDGGGENNFSTSTTWNRLDGLKIATLPGDVSFKVAGKPLKFQWDVAYNKDGSTRNSLYGAYTAATSGSAATNGTFLVAPNAGGALTQVTATTGDTGLTSGAKTVGSTFTATGTGTAGLAAGNYTIVAVQTNGAAAVAATSASNTRPVHSGRDDLAWLVGFQLGENKKKGDWSLLANYRQVGLSAVDPNYNDSDWALSQTNMAGYKVGFQYNIGDATTLGATYYYADNMRKDLGNNAGASAGPGSPGSASNSVQVLQVDMSVKF